MDTLKTSALTRLKSALINRKYLRKSVPNIRLNRKASIALSLALVFLLGTIAALIMYQPGEAGAWWDDTWGYRTKITITHNAADTFKKVKFDIDTAALISAGKMQSDCDDSRFTTLGGELIQYYVDAENGACNTNSTDYWVLIPEIFNGQTVIFHYYGNPSAEAGTMATQFVNDTLTPSGGSATGAEEKTEGPVAYWKFDEGTGTITHNQLNYSSTSSTSSGPNSPGTVIDDSSVGLTTWGNPSNASANDGAYASIVEPSSSGSHYLKATNFGFAIPDGATINGILVEVKRFATGAGDVYDSPAGNYIVKGGNVGSTGVQVNNSAGYWQVPDPGTYVSYGGASNLWGETWTSADINNSGFGVTIRAQEYESTSNSVFVDHIRITVYYTASVTSAGSITGATWQTEDMCISGKCLYFDGSNDYVNVGDFHEGQSSQTLQSWVRLNSAPSSGNYRVIMAKDKVGVLAVYNDSGTIKVHGNIGDGTDWGTGQNFGSLTTNKWHLVSAVISGTNVEIFVDGVSVGSGNTTKNMGSNSNARGIGSYPAAPTSQPWSGFIDEVKIYNYARTAAQIKADYASRGGSHGSSAVIASEAKQSLSDGLVGYWKMNEASGNASDSSGNAITLTNNGTTTYAAGKFGNGSEHVPASSQHFSTATTISGIKSVSFWTNPDSTTNYYISLTSGAYITSSSGTLSATGFTNPKIYVNGIESTTVVADTWQHITVTTEVAIAPDSFYIGRQGNNYYDGTLDEFRLYNRALSLAEVSALYNFAPGPVAHWKMDEKTGNTISDTSSYGNNSSTFTGNVRWGTGKFGSGLVFDNNDSVVRIPESPSTDFGAATNSYTMSAWIKTTDTTNTTDGIVAKNGNNTGAFPFRLVVTTGSKFASFAVSDGTNTVSNSGIKSLNDGKWHHVVGVRDAEANTIRMYIDGVLEDSDSTSSLGSLLNNDDVSIGNSRNSYTTDDFNGSIDDVRIYNYARTHKQIIQDMNAGHPSVGSPVGSAVAHYKFDEGADNTCIGGTNDVCNHGSGGSALDGAQSGMAVPATSTSGWTNSGKFGKALNFDGSNDVVTVTNTSAIDLNNSLASGFTFSTWIYANSDGENDVGQIFWKGNATYCRTVSQSGSNLDIECSLDLATSDATLNIASAITTGTWNHIAVSWTDDDDDEITIYVNGIKRGTSTNGSGAPAAESNNLLVGGTTTANFDGRIDDFKVYSYELTADEIKIDMNQGAAIVLGTEDTGAKLTDGTGNPAVGHWKLDEKTGDTPFDSTGHSTTNRLGSAAGADSSDPKWVSNGKYGSALSFDGGDFAAIAGGSTYNMGDFTLSLWLKYTSTSDMYAFSISNNVNGCISNRVGIRLNNSTVGTIRADGWISSAYHSLASTNNTYNDGNWHHVAFTRSGSTWSLYIDGKSAVTPATKFSNTLDNDWPTLGALRCTSGGPVILNYYNGLIDEVKIYNYARTSAQIAFDYNRGAPVGWWKFDECQGTTAYDFAPNANGGYNGNNGTINIGATGTYTSAGSCGSGTSTEAWNGGTNGKFGGSLALDGTDDNATIPNSTLHNVGTGDFTLVAWIKGNSMANSDVIFAKTDGGACSSAYGFHFAVFDSLYPTLHFCSTTGSHAKIQGTQSLANGQWYHLVISVDRDNSSNTKVYVNGSPVATTVANLDSHTGSITNTVDLAIGSESDGGFYWDGQIDDVRIYNYALSPTQVKEIMNNGTVYFGN